MKTLSSNHSDPSSTVAGGATDNTPTHLEKGMTATLAPNIIPTNLSEMASTTDIDPCDLAEAVMPDLILGDLAPEDESWVRNHTLTCSYCNGVLHSYEDVCTAMEACNESLDEMIPLQRPPSTANCLGLSEARFGFMETPVGDVLIVTSDKGVLEISYLREHDCHESLHEVEQRGFLVYERQDAVGTVIDELQQYFRHQRNAFSVPVDLTGVTEFTQRVLDATVDIPYGQVRTYGDVAGLIGKPGASRAVGNALGRNPVPVIIPCHRVILASGAMGWYTGGPDIKRTLLGIEGVVWQNQQQSLPI